MAKRIKYIDFLKFVAIYLVCMGHLIQELTGSDWDVRDNVVSIFSVAFHMPFFMMLSGLFLSSSLRQTFKDLLAKKFIRLLLPVFSAYAVYCLYYWIVKSTLPSLNIMDIGYFLWFLTSLFVCEVIAWVFMKVFRNDILAAVCSVGFVWGIRYFNYCYINFMLPFLWSGYFLWKYIDWIEKYKKSVLAVCLVAAIGLMCSGWSFYESFYAVPIQFISTNAFDGANLLSAFYRFFVGLTICILVFFILKTAYEKMSKAWGENRWLRWSTEVGTETLGIYIMQKFLIQTFLPHLGLGFSPVVTTILAITFGFMMCAICYWITCLLGKSPLTALLFLGKAMKKPQKQ